MCVCVCIRVHMYVCLSVCLSVSVHSHLLTCQEGHKGTLTGVVMVAGLKRGFSVAGILDVHNLLYSGWVESALSCC